MPEKENCDAELVDFQMASDEDFVGGDDVGAEEFAQHAADHVVVFEALGVEDGVDGGG
jgi:hypothetical protein